MSEEQVLPAFPDSCWPVDWTCTDKAFVDGLDGDVKARSEAMATQVLRALTGYQVGGCPITVRPCAKNCGRGSFRAAPTVGANMGALGTQVGPWWAMIDTDGQWINLACGCTQPCSCTSVPEVWLAAPVGAVTRVWVDGEVLDPSVYRVDDGFKLVRTDGGSWPLCQNMAAPADAQDAFAVTYFNNALVDGLGAWVAGILATEFAKSCTGAKCRLPSGVQTIARLGVSMEIPSGMFEGGLTGIREIDSWVRLWNPYQLRSPATVWSPDLDSPRRTTSWPVGS